jgi:hypothetical protein
MKVIAVTLWITTAINLSVSCLRLGSDGLFSNGSSVAQGDGVASVRACVAESAPQISGAALCSELAAAPGGACEDPQERIDRVTEAGEERGALKEVARRLDEAQLAREQHQLALKLVDSGQGVFRGFGPFAAGVRSPVERFQERIVQLEIERQGLLVKFSPQSPEVRALESEISGVRGAMRQCLLGSLAFLERDIETLSARKAELTAAAGKPGPKANARKSRRLHRPSGGVEPSVQAPSLKPVLDDAGLCPAPAGPIQEQGFLCAATSPGLRGPDPAAASQGCLFCAAELTRSMLGLGPWGASMFVQTDNLFEGRTHSAWEGRERLRKPQIQLPEFTAVTMRTGK